MTSEGRSFAQVILSKEQLRAGLMAEVDGVHIPSEGIAMTSLRAAELSSILDISFQKSFDELDEGLFAVLRFTAGFSVTLKGHVWPSMTGVQICTDPAGQYSSRRLEDILDGLHLSRDQLIWVTLGLE
jgi:hypothetical protein